MTIEGRQTLLPRDPRRPDHRYAFLHRVVRTFTPVYIGKPARLVNCAAVPFHARPPDRRRLIFGVPRIDKCPIEVLTERPAARPRAAKADDAYDPSDRLRAPPGEAVGILDAKVAVVTGGASGIGRAVALRCAAEGASVVVADVQDAAAVVDAARAQRQQIDCRRVDVAASAEVAALMRDVCARHGRLDVLVCAAGISGGTGLTADYPEPDFDQVIGINLKGVFLAMKHAIPQMLHGGGGAIVNIASIAGLIGLRGTPAYAAAKGGVIQLTKVAAVEYAERNVRVNCICPGMIDTPMVQRLPASAQEGFVARQPLSRLGTPDEIAAAAVFLAGPASAFTTGAALVVDGGYTAL